MNLKTKVAITALAGVTLGGGAYVASANNGSHRTLDNSEWCEREIWDAGLVPASWGFTENEAVADCVQAVESGLFPGRSAVKAYYEAEEK